MALSAIPLEKLKEISERGRAAATKEDLYQWEALDAAIEVAEEHAEALEAIGFDALKSALKLWSLSGPTATKVALIRGESMSQLTQGALADAGELRADTMRRSKEKEELVNFLLDLGRVGAKLLLAVVL